MGFEYCAGERRVASAGQFPPFSLRRYSHSLREAIHISHSSAEGTRGRAMAYAPTDRARVTMLVKRRPRPGACQGRVSDGALFTPAEWDFEDRFFQYPQRLFSR